MSASTSTDVSLTEHRVGMKWVPGGTFTMGSERFYPEEAPRRQVHVDGFWMDAGPVTNAAFAEFVAATGHVTFAELAPDPRDYPGMLPELAAAGSLVFEPSKGPVDTRVVSWWDYRIGAHWRTPLGPDSSIAGLEDHPVVHVTHADAAAYAKWAGKTLPTEAEWEFAACGGLPDADYAWGDELAPGGAMLANYWQGPFPHGNSLADGWLRTSPVGSYPANGYGLYDRIGNVWEWTADWFGPPRPERKTRGSCCIPANPRGALRHESIDRRDPSQPIPRKVLKGGSHLCAESYCQRYRPAARYAQPIDSSASHVGFRCVLRKTRA
jgi:sulfatase modifying factor 1